MPAEQLPLMKSSELRSPPKGVQALDSSSALHKAMEAFHAHMLSQDLSEYTVRAFDSDLRLLSRFIGARTPLSSIGTVCLERFLHYLSSERGVPCNAKSLARRLTTLKVFFAWLADTGIVRDDPAAPITHQPVVTPLPRVLSEAETAKLLEATQTRLFEAESSDARPHLLVNLLLDTGMKKGECMNIALVDLDTADAQAATVWIRYDSPKQRFKERRLRLSPTFVSALPHYLAQYQPKRMLFECTARNLEYVLDECTKRAGLPPRILSFEVLRWTCAMRDLKAGMDHDLLRRKLGLSHITWADTAEKLKRLTTPAL